MAEKQGDHRQSLELKVVESNCKAQQRGPVLGFVIAILAMLIGGLLLANGRELSGVATIMSALAAIVVPFVIGKRSQREELKDRRRELSPAGSEDKRAWDYSLPPERNKHLSGRGTINERAPSK